MEITLPVAFTASNPTSFPFVCTWDNPDNSTNKIVVFAAKIKSSTTAYIRTNSTTEMVAARWIAIGM